MKLPNIKDVSALTLFLFFFSLLITSIAQAATTSTVTATVTAQNIFVSVADATVAYGTLTLSGTEDTTSAGVNDTQTATNDGNVTEDFNISGQDSAAWTLAGTIGADQYTHEWCTTTCDSTPTWNNLTTSYQTLATGISSSGTQDFDLQIGVPSSSTSYTQQSVDVTVQAVAN